MFPSLIWILTVVQCFEEEKKTATAVWLIKYLIRLSESLMLRGTYSVNFADCFTPC